MKQGVNRKKKYEKGFRTEKRNLKQGGRNMKQGVEI